MLTRQEVKERAKIILAGEYSKYWIFIFIYLINGVFSTLIAMFSSYNSEMETIGIIKILLSKPTFGAVLLRTCIYQFFSTLIGLNYYRKCYDKVIYFRREEQKSGNSRITIKDAIYCCVFMTFIALLLELLSYPYVNSDTNFKMNYEIRFIYSLLVLLISTMVMYYTEILAIIFSFNPQKGLSECIRAAGECYFTNFWSVILFNVSFWGWWIVPMIIWISFSTFNNTTSITYAEYFVYELFSVFMFGIALFYSPYRQMSFVIFVNQITGESNKELRY